MSNGDYLKLSTKKELISIIEFTYLSLIFSCVFELTNHNILW